MAKHVNHRSRLMSFYKAAPLIAVLLGTAALNACSTMPDTANPAEWYRSTVDFFAGEDKAKIKMHGLVFAAGVVVSFWVVAVIWLGLQAAGTAAGWGFQMQNPPFVAIMAMFLFLFGLNLFGVFEIGASLTAAGGKVKSSGLRGTFVTGVIATVVASPCSAPFMGTALFAASTMSRAAGFLIFTALALGLSSPYIVLAFFPKFMRFLPRPGMWMLRFKQFMGFLLMGSVMVVFFNLVADVVYGFLDPRIRYE